MLFSISMWGLCISKNNKSVHGIDYKDAVYHSQIGSRTVKKKGTIDVTTTSAFWDDVTVTHDFGYVPQFDAFVETISGLVVPVPGVFYSATPAGKYCEPSCTSSGGQSYIRERFENRITTTTITFRVEAVCECRYGGSTFSTQIVGQEYTIHYYLYMESVDLPLS